MKTKQSLAILCLLGIQLSTLAPHTASAQTAVNEKTYYVFCDCQTDNNIDYIRTRVLFEPFPIKESKSATIPFWLGSIDIDYDKAFKLGRIFDQEHGINLIKPGDKLVDNWDLCIKYSTLDSAEQRLDYIANDIISYYKATNPTRLSIFIVAWQPPEKYTGIAPTDPTPRIRNANSDASNTKNTGGHITVEKQDTKFQEQEAKRIADAKKAEAQRQVKLLATRAQSQAEDKKRLQKFFEELKKRGRRQ